MCDTAEGSREVRTKSVIGQASQMTVCGFIGSSVRSSGFERLKGREGTAI